MQRQKAVIDPALSARVLSRFPMRYTAGPEPAQDRPAHVRAASGLAWLPLALTNGPQRELLAVIQDDAAFVALVDPATGLADAAPLPAAPGGVRLFQAERGNKQLKLDLEACVVGSVFGAPHLVAFGSGSSDQRERIVLLPCDTPFQSAERAAHVKDASAFYQRLRSETAFSGSELNLEGVVLRENPVSMRPELLLFQRGNGADREGRPALNATAIVSWPSFVAYLESDAAQAPVPALRAITHYDLGTVRDVRLTFTDATVGPRSSVLFLACAEASPNTVDDGEVLGTFVGVIGAEGDVRIAPLLDEAGAPSRDKAEGIVRDVRQAHRVVLTVDRDDPDLPSDLLHVALEGAWF
ncbi:MAG: hypothetical protein QM778_38135 [Myxococcales bacterium]